MTNQYIPKENLTAYERWEVAAFDEAERLARVLREAHPEPPPVVVEPPPPPPPPISEEELAAIREQAFAEGRAAGFEDGFRSGQADGYASGQALAQAEGKKIASLAAHFTRALENCETQLADELLSLAIDIAEQVLRASLRAEPGLLLPAVREAVAALANPHGHPSLFVHPDDAALVRERLGEQLSHSGWRIYEDAALARGGCRIDNNGAEVDATLPTRWRRALETLGRPGAWTEGAG